jgi:hypothetical protein
VLYRTRGRDLAWALRDDGTAVVQAGTSRCAFDLHAIAPDGRETPLGTVPGFEGDTGSSLASFAFSPDGRLLAVSGTSCPDPRQGGALHWRVAVYRVGARVEPTPLASFTVPDQADGGFPAPSGPSFSVDGRHVAFPFETGQGSFEPDKGASGHIVTGLLDLDLTHPTRQPVRRTVRPSGARCLVYHNHLLFGRDASTLTTIEGCPGAWRLVDVDRASGRVAPRLTLPDQAGVFADADFDAARTHLLLQKYPVRRPEDPSSVFVWDGGRSLRHLVDLKSVQLDGVTYVVGGARW